MTQLKFIIVFVLTCFIGRWFANDAAASIGLYALVTGPGTFMHELAHFTMAALFNGHPTGFSVLPSGDSLGHVLVAPNWYNSALIGMAPLLLAPATLLFMALAARCSLNSFISFALLTYMAACCWAACIPSSADYNVAMTYPESWLFAVPMLAGIALLTVRISFNMLHFTPRRGIQAI